MDFAFTEEQELFRRTVRQFAKEVLLPNYALWDKTDGSNAVMRRRMGELGLTGLRIPVCYGGMDADYVALGVACEEVGRGDASCGSLLAMHAVTGELLALFAQDEIREQYLRRMALGEITVGLAVTEAHCGSDAAAIATRAVRDGKHYVLTGEKSSISMPSGTSAMIVWAKTSPSEGPRGISAFVVPMDSPGISVSLSKGLGMRAMKRGSLQMDGVRVPAKNLIGEEGRGFHILMGQFDYARAILALQCIGIAEQTMEETIEYVKTRAAFGQPIARYQGVAFPIVEAATKLEAARLLSYQVLWLRGRGLPHTKESAMVKWWAPRLAFEIVHQMLLLYGHAGYGDDYPVGQRLRDVIGYSISDGTGEIMKLVMAREVLPQLREGRAGEPPASLLM